MRPALLATIAVIVAAPAAGRANPAEIFGFGSRAAGVAGAVSAWIDDFSAGYYNPAGIAFAHGKSVSVGAVASLTRLQVNGVNQEGSDPIGVVVGATAPVPLGGFLADRLHVGIGLYVLPSTLIRVTARLPDEPFYPYYDNRAQRLVVLPFLAARLTDTLALGVGVDVLAKVTGTVIAFEGPTRSLQPRVDEEIGANIALHAGLRWQPTAAHGLALVYRQAFGLPFATIADTVVAGEPLALNLRAEGLYTPHQVVAGYAFRDGATLVAADVTWAHWSAYEGPYVRVTSNLPLVGPLAGRTPEVSFSDTIGLRVGLEQGVGRVALRGGYGYETSAVPSDQPGVTNLLDGPKHTVSLGFGIALWRGLRVDAHLEGQFVGGRTLRKRIAPADEETAPFDGLHDEVLDNPSEPATLGAQISNPGYPTIDSGGQLFSGGITMELRL